MDHSSFVYLMAPDGKLSALFRPGQTAQDLADAIHARMATS
jgi:cytochrome oxidase Cu insertion factor (SCO1/SenC/PrrC family)